MRYRLLWKKAPTSFGAYVPALPGCIAVGESSQKVLHLAQKAIRLHVEGLKEEGQGIPIPHSSSLFVELQA
jgi:predicted RNase H-like HicB family nuclease